MNTTEKACIGFVIGFLILATGLCIYDKLQRQPTTCNAAFVHLELHSDRPIEDIVRDYESEADRVIRECEESDKETDFGKMT